MAEQLKLWYNEIFIDQLAKALKKEYSDFNINSFKTSVFDNHWDNLELKERMHHVTHNMHHHLPFDYTKQISIINKIVS